VDTILEKNENLVAGLVAKQGSKGRKTYNVAAKQALGELCSRPGVSVSRLALTHGVNANLLRRWAVQYSPTAKAPPPDMSVVQAQAALVPVSTEMEVPVPTGSPGPKPFIEVIFGATTVRVHGAVDPALLRTVLDCLDRRT
jgi:transposase-like protein